MRNIEPLTYRDDSVFIFQNYLFVFVFNPFLIFGLSFTKKGYFPFKKYKWRDIGRPLNDCPLVQKDVCKERRELDDSVCCTEHLFLQEFNRFTIQFIYLIDILSKNSFTRYKLYFFLLEFIFSKSSLLWTFPSFVWSL